MDSQPPWLAPPQTPAVSVHPSLKAALNSSVKSPVPRAGPVGCERGACGLRALGADGGAPQQIAPPGGKPQPEEKRENFAAGSGVLQYQGWRAELLLAAPFPSSPKSLPQDTSSIDVHNLILFLLQLFTFTSSRGCQHPMHSWGCPGRAASGCRGEQQLVVPLVVRGWLMGVMNSWRTAFKQHLKHA